MADQMPPDGAPTWLVAVLSVLGTLLGWRAWAPIGKWVGRRLDADRQARAIERGDLVARLTAELDASRAETRARVEENVSLRQELGEERELRMTFAADYAGLKVEVGLLREALADDKRDCQRDINRLNREIARLNREIAELRQQQQRGPAL